MSLQVVCPACNQRYKLKDEYGGKRVQCPACQSAMSVPLVASERPPDSNAVNKVERRAAAPQGSFVPGSVPAATPALTPITQVRAVCVPRAAQETIPPVVHNASPTPEPDPVAAAAAESDQPELGTWWEIEFADGRVQRFENLEEIQSLLLQEVITGQTRARSSKNKDWINIATGLANQELAIQALFRPLRAYVIKGGEIGTLVACVPVGLNWLFGASLYLGWRATLVLVATGLFTLIGSLIHRVVAIIVLIVGCGLFLALSSVKVGAPQFVGMVVIGLPLVVIVGGLLAAAIGWPLGAGVGYLVGLTRVGSLPVLPVAGGAVGKSDAILPKTKPISESGDTPACSTAAWHGEVGAFRRELPMTTARWVALLASALAIVSTALIVTFYPRDVSLERARASLDKSFHVKLPEYTRLVKGSGVSQKRLAPTLVGKVLAIDTENGRGAISEIQLLLPESLQANSPTEVRTLIGLNWSGTRGGEYLGDEAFYSCNVVIIDIQSRSQLAQQSFRLDRPPGGGRPIARILKYVQALPRSNRAH